MTAPGSDAAAGLEPARLATQRLFMHFVVLAGSWCLVWVLGAGWLGRWLMPSDDTAILVGAVTGLVLSGAWLAVGCVRMARRLRDGDGDGAARWAGAELVSAGFGLGAVQQLDPQEARLVEATHAVSQRLSIPRPKAWVWPSECHIDATSLGWAPSTSVLVLTRGALDHLAEAELRAVVAHQLQHIAAGHARLRMAALSMSHGFGWVQIAGNALRERDPQTGDPASPVRRAAGALLATVGTVALPWRWWLLRQASRGHETQADARLAGALPDLCVSFATTVRKVWYDADPARAGGRGRARSARAQVLAAFGFAQGAGGSDRAWARTLAARAERLTGGATSPLPSGLLALQALDDAGAGDLDEAGPIDPANLLHSPDEWTGAPGSDATDPARLDTWLGVPARTPERPVPAGGTGPKVEVVVAPDQRRLEPDDRLRVDAPAVVSRVPTVSAASVASDALAFASPATVADDTPAVAPIDTTGVPADRAAAPVLALLETAAEPEATSPAHGPEVPVAVDAEGPVTVVAAQPDAAPATPDLWTPSRPTGVAVDAMASAAAGAEDLGARLDALLDAPEPALIATHDPHWGAAPVASPPRLPDWGEPRLEPDRPPASDPAHAPGDFDASRVATFAEDGPASMPMANGTRTLGANTGMEQPHQGPASAHGDPVGREIAAARLSGDATTAAAHDRTESAAQATTRWAALRAAAQAGDASRTDVESQALAALAAQVLGTAAPVLPAAPAEAANTRAAAGPSAPAQTGMSLIASGLEPPTRTPATSQQSVSGRIASADGSPSSTDPVGFNAAENPATPSARPPLWARAVQRWVRGDASTSRRFADRLPAASPTDAAEAQALANAAARALPALPPISAADRERQAEAAANLEWQQAEWVARAALGSPLGRPQRLAAPDVSSPVAAPGAHTPSDEAQAIVSSAFGVTPRRPSGRAGRLALPAAWPAPGMPTGSGPVADAGTAAAAGSPVDPSAGASAPDPGHKPTPPLTTPAPLPAGPTPTAPVAARALRPRPWTPRGRSPEEERPLASPSVPAQAPLTGATDHRTPLSALASPQEAPTPPAERPLPTLPALPGVADDASGFMPTLRLDLRDPLGLSEAATETPLPPLSGWPSLGDADRVPTSKTDPPQGNDEPLPVLDRSLLDARDPDTPTSQPVTDAGDPDPWSGTSESFAPTQVMPLASLPDAPRPSAAATSREPLRGSAPDRLAVTPPAAPDLPTAATRSAPPTPPAVADPTPSFDLSAVELPPPSPRPVIRGRGLAPASQATGSTPLQRLLPEETAPREPATRTPAELAAARLLQVPSGAALHAAILACMLTNHHEREHRAWRVETAAVADADHILEDLHTQPRAAWVGWFSEWVRRAASAPLEQRRSLVEAARRVMTAAGVVKPLDRLRWLTLRHMLAGGGAHRRMLAAQSPVSGQAFYQANLSHIATYTAFLARLIPVYTAELGIDPVGERWYVAVLQRFIGVAPLPPCRVPDSDSLVHAVRALQELGWMHRPPLIRAWVGEALSHSGSGGLTPEAVDSLHMTCLLLDAPMPTELRRLVPPLPIRPGSVG